MSTAPLPTLARSVFLIGFMGAGKSSVACAVARENNLPFVDLDARIVERSGCTIKQIFESQGQEFFRDLEAAELRDVAQSGPQIVACGGGIVERQENVEVMCDTGFVVCFDVDFDEAVRRIGTDPDRPLFANREQARDLYHAREALYHQAADYVVDTTGRSIDDLAEDVRGTLLREGILSQS